MAELPCLSEFQGWIDALRETSRSHDELFDALAKENEARENAKEFCPKAGIIILDPLNVPDLPDFFFDLQNPPFNLNIPPTNQQEQDELFCFDALIDVNNAFQDGSDFLEILNLAHAAQEEAFDLLQDCVRHAMDQGIGGLFD